MNKYAIAYCNLFDGCNIIKVIHANSSLEALAILADSTSAGGTGDDYETIQEYIDYFGNADIMISEPLCIS